MLRSMLLSIKKGVLRAASDDGLAAFFVKVNKQPP